MKSKHHNLVYRYCRIGKLREELIRTMRVTKSLQLSLGLSLFSYCMRKPKKVIPL